MSTVTVEELLSAPDDAVAEAYLQQLVQRAGASVEVRLDSGGGKGKGVFATSDIQEEHVIFREQPLVGEQHSVNRKHALMCEQCFCYVGSLELQIGHQIAQLKPSHQALSDGLLAPQELRLSSLLPIGDVAAAACDMPPAVRCPGGCAHLFCGHECAARAWAGWHCLLCTGTRDPVAQCVAASPDTVAFERTECSASVRAETGFKGERHAHDGAASSSSSSSSVEALPPWIPGAVDTRSLASFYRHADSTNDAFRVGARLVAQIICQVHWLTRDDRGPHGARTEVPSEALDAALLRAWLPVRMAHKAVWWECVPMPAALTDEAAWREQLRELATDSLTLLRNAVAHDTLPALFHERVWGSIIGMFELNNLSLEVRSPVELFFLAVDDLPEPQRSDAMQVTQPLLDVLDSDYCVACEGTAFYCLQSCLNHAHVPSVHGVKGDEESDGCAVLTAKHDIKRGDELFISYVDEEEPLEERMAALRDYGIFE